MDISTINWLAVLVCAVASMVSGALWYSPKTFFLIWWKGLGKGDEVPGGKNMGLTWGLTVVSSLLQAAAFAVVLPLFGTVLGGVSPVSGMLTGVILWAGFVAPTHLVNKLFAGHGIKIWAIEVGNHLVNFVAFGAILGAWR